MGVGGQMAISNSMVRIGLAAGEESSRQSEGAARAKLLMQVWWLI